MMSKYNIDKFSEIFAGNTDHYGLYYEGKHKFVHQPVTKELYEKHLNGQLSLGIVPIRADGKCKFGCLDLDDHKKGGVKKEFNYKKLLEKIKFLKLPLVVCRSKSGGAHCYLFLEEWTEAAKVHPILKKMAYALGYKRGTVEIFPKQLKLEPGESGSFINLPYHNGNTRMVVSDE